MRTLMISRTVYEEDGTSFKVRALGTQNTKGKAVYFTTW